ncbi:16S rRNA (uracil(1498)-N(3))-methyltransferase [Sediminicurvatus halobius]|uniref:Ribosomal RNA small subunit methyltransferase E n=1 Tax=Sediminicurvatus halobius TaxID=2182432 RepID=A0A2U2MYA4_9GAMM|nr:16S rRNA (uracil(1498)-N(3))-methyltransferase [Spiribacter halobius]PWG61995.1 16S rRNA (uracil(1498)-N(3))-methyltransferase [Spiribacter halobius]UEX78402.1 16S rRNA (uracil(1498)-N(3))-methyltransferase [Spiribacter halobius]
MPNVTRLHVEDIPAPGGELALPAAALAHVQARRLKPGAELALFDGRGGEYRAVLLALGRREAQVRVEAHDPREAESPLQLTLLQGVSKGERMDFAVQKAVELGVSRIVPVLTARSVVRLDDRRAGRRQRHWQAVAASACEQCGRNRVPAIATPAPLAAALAEGAGACGLVLDPGSETGVAALPARPAYTLLVGPEGGLAPEEIAEAARAGFTRLRLGPRVLRTETAAVAALATLQLRFGDLG